MNLQIGFLAYQTHGKREKVNMKTNLKRISILLACAVLSSCSAKAENTEQTAAPTVQTTETQAESSAAAERIISLFKNISPIFFVISQAILQASVIFPLNARHFQNRSDRCRTDTLRND